MFNKKIILLVMMAALTLTSCSKYKTPGVADQFVNVSEQSVKAENVEKSAQDNNDDDKTKAKDEIYKNEVLGISFLIPENWSGKYYIKEDKEGLYVYFKSVEPVSEGEGLIFAILKRTSSDDENVFDSVGEPRIFKAKGITYITGGPTDIAFPESHKEFDDFIKMKKEVTEVVKTIKTD